MVISSTCEIKLEFTEQNDDSMKSALMENNFYEISGRDYIIISKSDKRVRDLFILITMITMKL